MLSIRNVGAAKFLFIIGLWVVASGYAARAEELIDGIPNAEDLIATADGQWIIASSMVGAAQKQGALYVIGAKTKSPRRIELANAEGTPLCPGGFRAETFAPHGITITSTPNGPKLYVVNHGPESIDRFSVTDQGGPPQLRWEDCIPLPKKAFGNAVAAKAGMVFVSNIGRALGGTEGVKGDLLQWSAETGWQAMPGSQGSSWNGLVISPDGGHLYAAGYRTHRIYEFSLGQPGSTRSLATGFLPDNLRWAKDGSILVAGQEEPVKAVVDCHYSAEPICDIDWAFGRVDPVAMEWTCTSQRKATPQFSSATTALQVGRDIWLGTTRGQAVLTTEDCTKGSMPPPAH